MGFNNKPVYSKDELEKAVSLVDNWSELISYFGKTYTGGTLKTIKSYIEKFGIDNSHFIKFKSPKNCKANFEKRKYTDDELFSVNDITPSIVKHHYKRLYPPVACSICDTGTKWMGKPLTPQIDHINGNSKDHRLENLRYLCPNCHTQTDTYGKKDRNKWKGGVKVKLVGDKSHTRKANWNEVYQAFQVDPCYTRIGRMFGITDNSVRKIIKKMTSEFTGTP